MNEGKFLVTGRLTEEKIVGKCSVCGLNTKTVVRHRKTKQLMGMSCMSIICRQPKKNTPELREAIDALVGSLKERNELPGL